MSTAMRQLAADEVALGPIAGFRLVHGIHETNKEK